MVLITGAKPAVAITGLNLPLILSRWIRGTVLALVISYATSFLPGVALKKRFYRQVI